MYWLYRGDEGYLYLSPRRAEGAIEVDAAFVRRHLNRLPDRAVRFTEADRSFPELAAELAAYEGGA